MAAPKSSDIFILCIGFLLIDPAKTAWRIRGKRMEIPENSWPNGPFSQRGTDAKRYFEPAWLRKNARSFALRRGSNFVYSSFVAGLPLLHSAIATSEKMKETLLSEPSSRLTAHASMTFGTIVLPLIGPQQRSFPAPK
jgi:hypothetical protein